MIDYEAKRRCDALVFITERHGQRLDSQITTIEALLARIQRMGERETKALSILAKLVDRVVDLEGRLDSETKLRNQQYQYARSRRTSPNGPLS